MTDPISVRVARLRGCEPSVYAHGLWHCNCEDLAHGNPRIGDSLLQNYTKPAAWALLLSEMVEAHDAAILRNFDEEGEPTGMDVRLSWRDWARMAEPAPTLGEAVALAWISWQEAQR